MNPKINGELRNKRRAETFFMFFQRKQTEKKNRDMGKSEMREYDDGGGVV